MIHPNSSPVVHQGVKLQYSAWSIAAIRTSVGDPHGTFDDTLLAMS